MPHVSDKHRKQSQEKIEKNTRAKYTIYGTKPEAQFVESHPSAKKQAKEALLSAGKFASVLKGRLLNSMLRGSRNTLTAKKAARMKPLDRRVDETYFAKVFITPQLLNWMLHVFPLTNPIAGFGFKTPKVDTFRFQRLLREFREALKSTSGSPFIMNLLKGGNYENAFSKFRGAIDPQNMQTTAENLLGLRGHQDIAGVTTPEEIEMLRDALLPLIHNYFSPDLVYDTPRFKAVDADPLWEMKSKVNRDIDGLLTLLADISKTSKIPDNKHLYEVYQIATQYYTYTMVESLVRLSASSGKSEIEKLYAFLNAPAPLGFRPIGAVPGVMPAIGNFGEMNPEIPREIMGNVIESVGKNSVTASVLSGMVDISSPLHVSFEEARRIVNEAAETAGVPEPQRLKLRDVLNAMEPGSPADEFGNKITEVVTGDGVSTLLVDSILHILLGGLAEGLVLDTGELIDSIASKDTRSLIQTVILGYGIGQGLRYLPLQAGLRGLMPGGVLEQANQLVVTGQRLGLDGGRVGVGLARAGARMVVRGLAGAIDMTQVVAREVAHGLAGVLNTPPQPELVVQNLVESAVDGDGYEAFGELHAQGAVEALPIADNGVLPRLVAAVQAPPPPGVVAGFPVGGAIPPHLDPSWAAPAVENIVLAGYAGAPRNALAAIEELRRVGWNFDALNEQQRNLIFRYMLDAPGRDIRTAAVDVVMSALGAAVALEKYSTNTAVRHSTETPTEFPEYTGVTRAEYAQPTPDTTNTATVGSLPNPQSTPQAMGTTVVPSTFYENLPPSGFDHGGGPSVGHYTQGAPHVNQPGLTRLEETVGLQFAKPTEALAPLPPDSKHCDNITKKQVIMKSQALVDAWGMNIGITRLRYSLEDPVELIKDEFHEIKRKILKFEDFILTKSGSGLSVERGRIFGGDVDIGAPYNRTSAPVDSDISGLVGAAPGVKPHEGRVKRMQPPTVFTPAQPPSKFLRGVSNARVPVVLNRVQGYNVNMEVNRESMQTGPRRPFYF